MAHLKRSFQIAFEKIFSNGSSAAKYHLRALTIAICIPMTISERDATQ